MISYLFSMTLEGAEILMFMNNTFTVSFITIFVIDLLFIAVTAIKIFNMNKTLTSFDHSVFDTEKDR